MADVLFSVGSASCSHSSCGGYGPFAEPATIETEKRHLAQRIEDLRRDLSSDEGGTSSTPQTIDDEAGWFAEKEEELKQCLDRLAQLRCYGGLFPLQDHPHYAEICLTPAGRIILRSRGGEEHMLSYAEMSKLVYVEPPAPNPCLRITWKEYSGVGALEVPVPAGTTLGEALSAQFTRYNQNKRTQLSAISRFCLEMITYYDLQYHEELLLDMWQRAYGGEHEGRRTVREGAPPIEWTRLGFQDGARPELDLRSTGVACLTQVHYFALTYPSLFAKIVASSEGKYPLILAAAHITQLMHNLLEVQPEGVYGERPRVDWAEDERGSGLLRVVCAIAHPHSIEELFVLFFEYYHLATQQFVFREEYDYFTVLQLVRENICGALSKDPLSLEELQVLLGLS